MYNNMNPLNMLFQIKNNPSQFLAQRGFQIPDGMNNPNDIINHLMGTGKFTQAQVEQATNMAKMFMR